MQFIGPIMLLGAGISAGYTAITYPKKYSDAQDALSSAQKNLDDYKKAFTKIIKAEDEDLEDIKEDISSALDGIQGNQQTLKAIKDTYNIQYHTNQLIGIIFIVIIAFLLIAKRFKLFSIFE